MRFLLTGATGMLGQDLQAVLAARKFTALSRSDLDVTDADAVRQAVSGHDVVINCAAYTKVDDAEKNEDLAYAVNALGARNLAVAARLSGARIIQISTDYVFNGTATEPYPEETVCDPISAYGRTKAAGERFVIEEHPTGSFIVRTAWLYGQHGPNFPATILRLLRDRGEVAVITDQVGQPTWTLDLAHQLIALIDTNAPTGIYHAANSGVASWFELAQAVFQEAGFDPAKVKPTDSSQFVRPAPRPGYSVLGQAAWTRAGIEPMRDWRSALHDAMLSGIFGD